jgi:hypothetical protein
MDCIGGVPDSSQMDRKDRFGVAVPFVYPASMGMDLVGMVFVRSDM